MWSLPLDSNIGKSASAPKQISSFSDVVLANLMGTPNQQRLFMIRTESAAQIYTADWQTGPKPSLRDPMRMTYEQTCNFPHARSADSESVLFESSRNGHLAIFQQNRHRREPEVLAASERENYFHSGP